MCILLSFTLAAVGQERRLQCKADALAGDMLKSGVWDFSRQWRSDDGTGALVRVYGDSLLAETVGGRRYWYSLSHDSIFFCGEEDRLTSISPDSAVFVATRPAAFAYSNNSTSFEARGTGGGKRFAVSENITVDYAASDRRGTLVLAPGDTIHNVLAVRERRYVTPSFLSDSTLDATLTMTETVRWYDGNGTETLLPVALQYSVYSPYSPSSPTPAFSAAYLPEAGEYEPRTRQSDSDMPDADFTAIEKALADAVITCDGRKVSASLSLPRSGLDIRLDIVDAAGHAFLHESFVSSGSADLLTIDCSSLRNGEYIAVLSVENIPASPKKELIIVR